MGTYRRDIKRLDEGFLACRDLGHAWSELERESVRAIYAKTSFGWLRVFVCERCTTERKQIIDTYGEVTSNSYVYPDGYQLEEWTPAKAPFRREIARRRGIRIPKQRTNNGQ